MPLKIEARIIGIVRDKKGRFVTRKVQECHSYVKGMIDLLYSQMGYATLTVYDTGNAGRSVATNANNLNTNAGTATITYGIRVGIGTTTVTVDDVALNNACGEGTGANAFQHAAVTFSAPATSGASRIFNINRTITNNSGSDITIEEVGLYARGGTTPFYFMIERTLYTLLVANTNSATLTYEIKCTVT